MRNKKWLKFSCFFTNEKRTSSQKNASSGNVRSGKTMRDYAEKVNSFPDDISLAKADEEGILRSLLRTDFRTKCNIFHAGTEVRDGCRFRRSVRRR